MKEIQGDVETKANKLTIVFLSVFLLSLFSKLFSMEPVGDLVERYRKGALTEYQYYDEAAKRGADYWGRIIEKNPEGLTFIVKVQVKEKEKEKEKFVTCLPHGLNPYNIKKGDRAGIIISPIKEDKGLKGRMIQTISEDIY